MIKQKMNAADEEKPCAAQGGDAAAADGGAVKPHTDRRGFIQFLKFLCVSLGAGVVEFGSFTLLDLIFRSVWHTDILPKGTIIWIEIVSVALSCLFNFTVNRKFTFKAATNIALGMVMYGAYYALATPLGALFITFLQTHGLSEFLAKAIKMVLNFALDFLYCKFVIFNKKISDKILSRGKREKS